jgi:hypothetical protein
LPVVSGVTCHWVLPAATTHSNIRPKEYSVNVDAIVKQLAFQNRVTSALVGCTSTNKFAIMSFNTYYRDRHWALRVVNSPSIRLIPYFSQLSLANKGWKMKHKQTGAWQAVHWMEVFDCFEPINSHLLGIGQRMLPQITLALVSCNQPLSVPESTGLHWGITYHAWCTSYSCF